MVVVKNACLKTGLSNDKKQCVYIWVDWVQVVFIAGQFSFCCLDKHYLSQICAAWEGSK